MGSPVQGPKGKARQVDSGWLVEVGTHILPLYTSILGSDSRFTDGGQIGTYDSQEGPTTRK